MEEMNLTLYEPETANSLNDDDGDDKDDDDTLVKSKEKGKEAENGLSKTALRETAREIARIIEMDKIEDEQKAVQKKEEQRKSGKAEKGVKPFKVPVKRSLNKKLRISKTCGKYS